MTRWPKISQICTEIPISSSLQRNVFGDAGVESSDTVIPLFKRERKTQVTVGPKAYFNHKCAKARVMTEQAFGILKNRWQILQDCCLTCRTVTDEAHLYLAFKPTWFFITFWLRLGRTR
ncbi:hypothetical protein J007_06415 [Cryptococcus neoformans]|nr:hypothetical protein J007_06415 [Cryptococcus neoformans var. grubii]OXC58058.1 hypothetical protein C358_06509 [Cryptococcus neoformans var. grubii MW-RSA852]